MSFLENERAFRRQDVIPVVLCGSHRTVLSDEVDIHLVEIRRSSLLRMTAVEV
jgi:hypothetical protein